MSTYQLFPALTNEVEDALRASIKRWGVIVPIVRDQNGGVLDGHHRSRIADELGLSYEVTTMFVDSDEDRVEIVRTLNVDRGLRLDADLRQDIVVALYAEGHSQRSIAAALGVAQSTVHNDLHGDDGGYLSPDRCRSGDKKTVGVDGKTYSRSELDADAIFDMAAEIDADGVGAHPLPDIAEKFGCTRNTIWRHLRKHPRRSELPTLRRSVRGTPIAVDLKPLLSGRSSGARLNRVERAKVLATEGATSKQIADELGVSGHIVREYAKAHDFDIPADATTRGRAIDSARIVATAVDSLDGIGAMFDHIDFASLPTDELAGWITALDASIRSLTKLKKQLAKEMIQP